MLGDAHSYCTGGAARHVRKRCLSGATVWWEAERSASMVGPQTALTMSGLSNPELVFAVRLKRVAWFDRCGVRTVFGLELLGIVAKLPC